jgi:hypothetical protein
MEYLIFFVLILFIFGWLFNSKVKTKKVSVGNNTKTTLIKIFQKIEDDNGLTVFLKVDVFYELRCQFLRNGSPWVDLYNNDDGIGASYNVKTSRWKDGDSPVIPEYQRKVTTFIKEQWLAAWEDFGKPEFDTGRKKPAPPPSHVDFSKTPITLDFMPEKISEFRKEYEVEGSSDSKYKIMLKDLQCTCPDFIKRRSHYPPTDIRRVCKHMARLIINLKINTKISKNSMTQAFIRVAAGSGKGVYRFDKFYEIKINDEVKGPNPFYILLPAEEKIWAEVLFFGKRSYENYGYHLKEKRWGKHNNPFPPGSRQKFNWVMSKIAEEA